MKSVPAVWRDVIRDASELDRTAKLVGVVLSTYMNGQGHAYPAVETIALGGSLGRRGVQYALRRLENAGFLTVGMSRGGSSNSYLAAVPETAHAVRRSEWATVHGATPNRA